MRAAGVQAGEATPESRPSRPVLEVLFEGDLADMSAAKRRCTSSGAVTFAEGRHGKCALFDGRNWIDTHFPQKELGDEFTVECWVNPGPQQNAHADIFGNHVGEGLGFVLQQDGTSTNQFYAAYGAGGGRWVLTPVVPLAPGRWQHVALVKTREELRFYLNGVLVAAEQDTARVRPSPMPVAVGLGYSDQARCFRGLIDDFRIWNRALATFDHAGIDPAAAQDTRSLCLEATPRPAAGPLTQSWTLATDDTRLTLGVTASSELVLSELSCPAAGRNWIAHPVAFGLLPQVETGGQRHSAQWRLAGAALEEISGRRLTLRFACAEPALEIACQWHAFPGPGPIHQSMIVANRSTQTVTIGEQPTFDLDLTGAVALWSFHSDGGTPDPVGVYRRRLTGKPAGRRYSVRTAPSGEFIPLIVLEANDRQGVYMGLGWSYCRIDAATLACGASPTVRVRAGNFSDLRVELAPGESCEIRPGFLGAYCGDLDAAGNSLRRWLLRHRVPDILRRDPGYPKVQWNAFGATGKTPGSWDPVEKKFYPLVDDIAPLGFEEVMIDVGWWQGNEPDSDRADWPSGMRRAADYAHAKGLRFGLYWTDNLDMASPAGRRQRAARITRLFHDYHADSWRSDSTRGDVIGPSYAATRGFYEMVDMLAKKIPGFQWENCSGGGRIKDYGAMRRAVKIFNSDTYSPLHVRQAFYDSSHAFHPMQIEGHLGSTDGRYRPRGPAGMKYAFRSMSMGAPEWFLDAPNGGNGTEPWTQPEKDAVKACVATYKARLRPLVRTADLYHILPRPDGRKWDGVEYYDPAAGKGVVYLFKPSPGPAAETIRLKGLDANETYRVGFEDGTHPASVQSGAALMDQGLRVKLDGAEVSELVFFEVAPAAQAEMALVGGKIITLDARNSIAEALAIRGGRILAVGSEAEVARHLGPGTKTVPLAGKTVIPGIMESHVHAIGVARDSLGQPYAELSSIAEVQDWIRRRARGLPPGTWIEVPRNDITRLAERRHPTPAELDAACATHPVAFEAARKWALNSLGFRLAGIGDGNKQPAGVQVLRDAAGKPRLLADRSGIIRRFLPYPQRTREQTLDALTRLLRRYNEVGITSINERATDRDGYDLYRALCERGVRIVRVTATFRGSMRSAADVARFVERLGLKPGEGDDWVRAGPLKITIDGGIHWGNTHLREPYGPKRAKFYALDDPDYRGEIYYSVDEMRDVFAAGHRMGWPMCCHVTGDAGVDRVLDALEAAARDAPIAGRRFTLVHAYFPAADAIRRASRLGVCVDTQPYLYYKDSEAIAEVYGPGWAARLIGLGDWLRGGVPAAISSDHMIGLDPDHAMNSFNPFLQMAIAIRRTNERGRTWGNQQAISRIDALRSMTSTAAYVNGTEGKTGSLEPGKLADLVVLDRDFLTCPEEEIREIKVLATIVGGSVVYERK